MNRASTDTTRLSPEERTELARAKRAARFVGLVAPLALTAIATVVILAWMPRLPDPLAVHWGVSGAADGFGSAWLSLGMYLLVSLLLTGIYFTQALLSWQARQKPGGDVWGPMHRLLPAIVLGSVTLMFVIWVGTSWAQLDLADARDMPSVNGTMIASYIAGIAVVLGAYFVQPKLTISAAKVKGRASPLPLAESERAMWIGEARSSRGLLWFGGITILLLIAFSIWTFSIEPVGGWITLATLALVVPAVSISMWFRVRIDERGLEARALFGWPVFRVPAEDVESVVATHIVPLAEYGGWGIRWAPGRTGIVLRTGEGIVITRRSGKILAVTIDDAETAASVLAAAARRASGRGGLDEGGAS